MTPEIEGLHHVTVLASQAPRNNAFFTEVLGLRRVKTTVNFDAPSMYHLYYGDRVGTPGTVITYFPIKHAKRGQAGTGEVSETAFAIPDGSLVAWQRRLERNEVRTIASQTRFGARRLSFDGPDGERLALVEAAGGGHAWTGSTADEALAIRGLHSVTLRLADIGPTAELLRLLGYRDAGRDGETVRFSLRQHNGAAAIDLAQSDRDPAIEGAGSVHHIAFAVADDAAQGRMRAILTDSGLNVTPPIDRTYFRSLYFRSPGSVLFEVATNGPGFTHDEDEADLGKALMLPRQHEHLRTRLEGGMLDPLEE